MGKNTIKLLHDTVNWTSVMGILLIVGGLWQTVASGHVFVMLYPIIISTICFSIATITHKIKIKLEKREIKKQNE